MSLLEELGADLPKDMEFSAAELRLIRLAQAQLDDIARLESVIESEDAVVSGHAGQPRLHAAFAEVRQARAVAGRLIALVGVSIEKSESGKSGSRYRASDPRRGR